MTGSPIYRMIAAALLASSCVLGPKEDYSGVPQTPTVADQVGRIDLSSYWPSPLDCWDEMHALSTLQGIVNRTTATLYIDYVGEDGKNIDKYWWDIYSAAGEWLSGVNVETFNTPLEVINAYKDKVKGVVVYDPAVASTSNVASSVAGIEDLIAIRYNPEAGSLFSKVVKAGLLPVKVWLVNEDGTSRFTGTGTIPGTALPSTGSAKCDAYYWFIENYIKAGKCDTSWAGYYIDQFWLGCPLNVKGDLHCLTNHDFFVSKRGFFFDLCPWGDSVNDDPGQPTGTDLQTMRDLMMAAYQSRNPESICYVGGFPSWAHKYTNAQGGSRDAVATEWEFTRILSQYNACIDADAINNGAMANASFWQHFPLKEEYPQEWVSRESLKDRGLLKEDGSVNLDDDREYYIFYAGDWDASSWIYQQACGVWDDPERGSVPLMWPFGPALSIRAPQVMNYFYSTATANDYFVAADNGAGYLNPGELSEPRESGLPSGVNAWKNHCKKFYRQWGMTVTGFIIDGFSSPMSEEAMDAYSEFSPNGIVLQRACAALAIHKGMPVMKASSNDLNKDNSPVTEAAHLIGNIQQERESTGQRFHWCRVVLARPSWYKSVVETVSQSRPNYVLLDAPSFFELLRIYQEE